MSKRKEHTDPSLLPTSEALGKRNRGRRSTRRSYASASLDRTPSEITNFWKWEGARQGVLFDDEGNMIDEHGDRVDPNNSHWTAIYADLRAKIMDMRADSLHRERMAAVVKEIGMPSFHCFPVFERDHYD